MKLEFSGQIFEKKSSNIEFYKNPSSGSRVPCGRTDKHDEIVAFRDFANAPNKDRFIIKYVIDWAVGGSTCVLFSGIIP
jgi:hypothetical protein